MYYQVCGFTQFLKWTGETGNGPGFRASNGYLMKYMPCGNRSTGKNQRSLPPTNSESGREKRRDKDINRVSQTFLAPPTQTQVGLKKDRARATVKNYLIETPMSKCNNKQKYTCINMYI